MKQPFYKTGWIQDVTESIKKRGTKGVCTGSKFGGPSCPPGSKRYNLANPSLKKDYPEDFLTSVSMHQQSLGNELRNPPTP